jgi:D-arabinose 5-phosphate isomerase GutQ
MTNQLTIETMITRAREVIAAEAAAVAALAGQMDENVLAVVQALFDCRGHVLVTGAGTSAATARRFAHLLSCCGTPALFVDASDSLHGGAGAITGRDVVYIISKGGHSAEINQFADLAHARRARVVAHTESPHAPLAQKADVIFHISTTGDVDPYGMIATGSSLVNAAACDVLCVLLLEKRGYTREQFGRTHPSGAVGRQLAGEKP